MNSHTQKVASVGFTGLAIFSAVVLFFPLAYQILPEVLQENNAFQLAYALVAACWMLAVFLATLFAMNDTDEKFCREYCDSLPESGDGDDEDDDEGDGDDEDEEDDEEDENGGDDYASPDDTEVFESDHSDEPTDEEVQSAINSLATPDRGFVRADEIKPSPYQTGIQVFRVPGGTLKPGS